MFEERVKDLSRIMDEALNEAQRLVGDWKCTTDAPCRQCRFSRLCEDFSRLEEALSEFISEAHYQYYVVSWDKEED